MVPTVEEALRGADAAVIATEWPIYREVNWAAVRTTMRRPVIVDGKRFAPVCTAQVDVHRDNRHTPAARAMSGFSHKLS